MTIWQWVVCGVLCFVAIDTALILTRAKHEGLFANPGQFLATSVCAGLYGAMLGYLWNL